MDNGKTSQKLLLTKNKQFIEIVAQTGQVNAESENDVIITLDYFLNICEDNCFNDSIKMDKISTLNLSHCQLTDIPLSFQSLNLKSLTLSHNKFRNVPVCLYNGMEKLDYLDIGHNLLENFDLLPACSFNIKILKINNNLLSVLPKWIIKSPSLNLQELNFSYNKAIGYQYSKNCYTTSMMKVKKLKLKNSHLRDIHFDFLKCFQNLEYLDISNKEDKSVNRILEADNLFVNLKWKQLKILKMNNLCISLFPKGIMWLESLTKLYIKKNCISWLPDGIEFMVNLQLLDISENTLAYLPDAITKLANLEVIIAFGNTIEICPDLSKMESLKVLDLYDNSLESILLNCDNLESFDIDYNYLDTNQFTNYSIKRNKLRLQNKEHVSRWDCQKLKTVYQELRNSSSSDEEPDHYNNDGSPVSAIIDENWDMPVSESERNPEIDSEDEQWTGYEDICFKNLGVKKKLYVDDEDWMFEDYGDEFES